MLLVTFVDMESGIHICIILVWSLWNQILLLLLLLLLLQFAKCSALATDFESLRHLFANSISYLLWCLPIVWWCFFVCCLQFGVFSWNWNHATKWGVTRFTSACWVGFSMWIGFGLGLCGWLCFAGSRLTADSFEFKHARTWGKTRDLGALS